MIVVQTARCIGQDGILVNFVYIQCIAQEETTFTSRQMHKPGFKETVLGSFQNLGPRGGWGRGRISSVSASEAITDTESNPTREAIYKMSFIVIGNVEHSFHFFSWRIQKRNGLKLGPYIYNWFSFLGQGLYNAITTLNTPRQPHKRQTSLLGSDY
ncbi:hypothetical protein BDB01DRAFT_901170 [Pilobolus umbonatus]|nr:hypothetical protein BDB01DRAFT_901170 [Pilobolus umbonatus]